MPVRFLSTNQDNDFVSIALINMVLTLMPGETPGQGWKDSLLNPRNAKDAKEHLKNLRLACVGAGELVLYTPYRNYWETQRLLEQQFGAPPEVVDPILNWLDNVTNGVYSQPAPLLPVGPPSWPSCSHGAGAGPAAGPAGSDGRTGPCCSQGDLHAITPICSDSLFFGWLEAG